MADKAVISNSILNDTAAAIQEKDGDLTPMLPQEMPARIRAIPQGSIPPSLKALTRIEDYLYEATCGDLKEDEAEVYFRARFWDGTIPSNGSALGACSSFRSDNFFGRNYDWKYDNSVSFALHTLAEDGKRHASIAMCGSPDGIDRAAVEGGYVPEELWDVMPFFALDGINDHGVVCNVNVVPAHESEGWNGTEFCAISGVRKVLDYAKTALEGATMLAEKAWMPKAELFGGYSLHFMVADMEHTYIVEDGQVYDVTNDESRKIMTNFRIGGKDFLTDGKVDVNKIAAYDPFGQGAERYSNTRKMIEPGSYTPYLILSISWFSASYLNRQTSDFVGSAIDELGRKLKINETDSIKEWFARENILVKWLNRTRNGEFWQTVHSAVYDIEKRTLSVTVQEQGFYRAHDFLLDGDLKDFAKKSDIPDVVAPASYTTFKNGKAADEGYVEQALGEKLDKNENIGFRQFEFGGTKFDVLYLGNENKPEGGLVSITKEKHGENGAVFAFRVSDGKGNITVVTLENTGKDNEKFALVSQLSGITSQDVADFLKLGVATAWDSTKNYNVGEYVVSNHGAISLYRCLVANSDKDPNSSVGYWELCFEWFGDGFEYLEAFGEGRKKLVKLFGSDNEYLKEVIGKNAVIYLKYENGVIKNGDVTLTKFSDLAKIVKTGRAVLQATATSATGSSPVLFRPHMINDGTGEQAANILFDATGTIGEGVYTRCIRAAKKAGTDDELLVQGDNQRERLAKYSDLPHFEYLGDGRFKYVGQVTDTTSV